MIAYISIGNSDDKLSQAEWSAFAQRVCITVRARASAIHGEWYSPPASPWQNMCVCAEFSDPDLPYIRKELAGLRAAWQQESIAFAIAQTEFI
jgi:hypothetical protein